MKLVTVTLVTWNSMKYLPSCIDCLRRQQDVEYELIVVDNDSNDGTLSYLEKQSDLTLVRNKKNVGFCEAHNTAISMASGKYILVLNPDAFLTPHFLSQMVHAIELDGRIGQVFGKLCRISDSAEVGNSKILDSVGMFFTPNQRHFDRGAGEIDVGQYERFEYIFGVSGAAAFYRKSALDDVAFNGEYFDKRFFAYREDADLSWRMQLMGWKSLYTPYAQAYHARAVRENAHRKDINAIVNMHSVKNRFLMRIKNQTWKNGFRFFFPVLWRDMLVVGYVIFCEWSSLPAFWSLFTLYPEMLRKRRAIMDKRRVSDAYIAQWFNQRAVSFNSGREE